MVAGAVVATVLITGAGIVMKQQQALVGTRVLVVEDDANLREALTDTLILAGSEVLQADSGEVALQLLAEHYVDMVVSDVNMGGMDGFELLKAVTRQYPQLPLLLITAYASIEKSVEAMRNGAVDYLVKPFKPQLLVETVARFVGLGDCDAEQPVAVEQSSQQLLQLARRVAGTDSTVLICGESGTGKEVLARYIHRQSPRASGPFVAINCAAIPENMLEAILFGHEKGAFTGAHAALPGKFEQANGGTLLLDEVSEMPLMLQAKLLRVLQEREVDRLGGRHTITLDVRVLATTNRDLRGEVGAGRFREDLYYRLSVFPLQWLPLRQRRDDIAAIANKLLQQHAAKMGRGTVSFDNAALRTLRECVWPGNVRELDNVVQRALIMQQGSLLTVSDLCLDPFQAAAASNVPQALPEANGLGDDLQRHEFEIIVDTLRESGGSRKTTAERLGISPRTLRYKLARMREVGFHAEGLLAEG
jgi:two-component system response regulator FlrC